MQVPNPRAGRNLGISMIHQELALANHLTVAQNIYMGREPRGRLSFMVDDKQQTRQTEELIERLGLRLDPSVKCGELKVAQQQMVEIAKALSLDASVLIMDEPTAALTDTEIEELFRIIRTLREQGKGIVHISHRLEELRRISDRVTVMRDGQHVDTVKTADVSIDEIISMMVGRTIFEEAPHVPEDADQQPYVLEVRNLSRGRSVQDVSFGLRQGEILGIAGLVGAGRTELARLIFGADQKDAGEIIVKGESVEVRSPAEAVGMGIAYSVRGPQAARLDAGPRSRDQHRARVLRQVPQVALAGGHEQDQGRCRGAGRGARYQDAEHQARRRATSLAATSRRWSSPSG